MQTVIENCSTRMKKSVESLSQEFASLRTGRASAQLFDKIKVELVVARAVAVYPRFVCRNIAVVALYADDYVLTVLFGCLAHFSAYERHRAELFVEYCLNLHI